MVARRLIRRAGTVELKLHGLVGVLLLLGACSSNGTPGTPPAMQEVTIHGRRFTLELALDSAARYRGLSGRTSIPDDGGMLFVFPYPLETSFVMRDCPNPIDVMFLGPNGRVVSMYAMQPEPGVPEQALTRYPSRWPMQFAIELKGGTLAELGVEPGERIDLPLEALKKLAR